MAKFSNVLAGTGQFCTVEFIKSDGTIRKVNGRANVQKYIKGTGARSENTKSKYLLLWTRNGSRRFDAARNIARDKIISIKAHGIIMRWNNASNYTKTV